MFEFVENIINPTAWDSYIMQHAGPDGGLLQSFAWGEVQRTYGRRVWRTAVTGNHGIVLGWQIIENSLPFSQRFWYVPRPTEQQTVNSKQQELFHQGLFTLARRKKAIFIRVDAGANSKLADYGFKKISGSVQPCEELHVDVTPDADAILSTMKQKTRYNIKLSQKHGVEVSELPLDDHGFAIFFPLVRAMAIRQKILIHPEAYYRAMFSHFTAAGIGHLLVANWQGTPLAAALLVSYNHVLTYLHGGSADTQGEVMAPHLLHWQAILLAKTLGCRKYNLGGVSEKNAAWAGITRFKQGFSPNAKFTTYGGVWERPVRFAWYKIYWTARIFKGLSVRHRMT